MPENTNGQQPPPEQTQQPTRPEEPISEIAKFYQDLLVKIMGFGLAVIVLICVGLMQPSETEIFSVQDPNKVAIEAASLKGTQDSNEYRAEFKKVFSGAHKSRNRARIYLGIITIGTIGWVWAILAVWLKYHDACRNQRLAIPLTWVLVSCSALILIQFVLAIFVLDIDELGLSGFLKLLLK